MNSSARPSSSYLRYLNNLTDEQRAWQRKVDASVEAQIRESNASVRALQMERARNASANFSNGKVADNIRMTKVPLKEQKAFSATFNKERREMARSDRISEQSAEKERLARLRIKEQQEQQEQQERTSSQGGYTKLTKIGLLARIMNIKKKAAKAAKAAKAKAKPAVRKAKPVAKPAKRIAKPKRA
jgi:hypothetical protein